jgi:6-phosphogluconolactonase
VHGLAAAPGATNSSTLLYAADLGLDRVFWYDFDPATGLLVNGTANAATGANFVWTALGAGPRHLALTPTAQGQVVHVVCELSSTIETFAVEAATGALGERIAAISTVTSASSEGAVEGGAVAEPWPSPSPTSSSTKAGEILSSASGKFVYASNRGVAAGSNSVAVFEVDPSSGRLVPVELVPTPGTFPRGMALVPTGPSPEAPALAAVKLLVGGQDSGDVAIFDVDSTTGRLRLVENVGGFFTPVTFAL